MEIINTDVMQMLISTEPGNECYVNDGSGFVSCYVACYAHGTN